MILYFVRHGRAEDRADWPPANDHLRPLTEDGIQDMKKAAAALRKLGVRPAAILTSPLVRARQTAEIVAEALGMPFEETAALEPGFGVGQLIDLLDAHPGTESLLLVGHEPDFGIVVQMLCGGGRVEVKKGSLIRVDLFATQPPAGTLVWNIPPKALML